MSLDMSEKDIKSSYMSVLLQGGRPGREPQPSPLRGEANGLGSLGEL